MPQVKAVVFDVGGVLIEWDPRHLYRKLFPGEPEAMERFLATVCTPSWNAEQDRGRPWKDAVAELSARYPEHADLIAAYDERWEEMVPGPVPGVPDVLDALQRAGVPCYALTNFSTDKFALACRRFAFLNAFDGLVVSGAEGVTKPEAKIFEVLVDRYQLQPSRTLFIDDQPANVAAADRLGLRTHHFVSAERLRADLGARGLLRS